MTDTIAYSRLTDEALLALLHTEEDRLPRAAVDEFLARAPRMIGPLTQIISDPKRWDAAVPAWWVPIHATFILGAIGGDEAMPGLLAAMREADRTECDWVISGLPAILGRLGKTIRPRLMEIALDRKQPPYLRAGACEALASTTLTDPAGREEIFGLLASLFAEPNPEDGFKDVVGNLLLDFRVTAARDALLAFARAMEADRRKGKLLAIAFSTEHVEETFFQQAPTLARYTQNWLDFYEPNAIAARQARWAKEDASIPGDPDSREGWHSLADTVPTAPVLRLEPKVGRNDPCPCGSGKKYKKCCLGKAPNTESSISESTSETYSKADRASALAKLTTFADRHEFDEDRRVALMLFWGSDLADRAPEEMKRFEVLPQGPITFQAWWFFDCEVEDGVTVTDLFLERQRAHLGPGEWAYLRQARATYQSLYEVEEVRPDEGLWLTDLWSGERVWVRERAGTRSIVQWEILATRLMRQPDGEWEIEGSALQFSPGVKGSLLKRLKHKHTGFKRAFPAADAHVFLKRVGVYFGRWWLELAVFPPLPKVVTAEGDELVLAKSMFDVLNQESLRSALRSCPVLDELEPDVFDWFEDTPNFRRTLGTIRIEQDRVVLETTSHERAERGRKLLEEAAGDALWYRLTVYEDLKQALERTQRHGPSEPKACLPPKVEAEALKLFYDRYYRRWPDEPLRALGGRTPRHAARLKSQQTKVIELLKQLEHGEARTAREGRKPYDFGWLWKDLGLERP